jgi:transcriptional regulator with GAF, ATPase, and Fis domain
VGKELVANAIHRHGSRSDKPFIRVNCSALSESLITSELFGHEKGAFTGAINKRMGRFELANGGTLFLDEIGELPMEVQVRLLRILQTKQFERVGGTQTLKSDFRLIVATNRNLAEEVLNKRFRQDLFYRINVFPIEVPPLRSRTEDIPLLAYYFLKTNSEKMGKSVTKITQSVMDKLISYSWPGNVRELENVIERGVILSTDCIFRMPELEADKVKSPAAGEGILTFEENERSLILNALKLTGGKINGRGGVADLLKINRNTLYYRMKKLGIKK